jgi:hypothetical protein
MNSTVSLMAAIALPNKLGFRFVRRAKRKTTICYRRVFSILLRVQIRPAGELPQTGRARQIAHLPNFQLQSSAGAKVVWQIRGPAQWQDGHAFFVLRVLTF